MQADVKTYLTVGAGRVHLSFPAQKACLLFMCLEGWYIPANVRSRTLQSADSFSPFQSPVVISPSAFWHRRSYHPRRFARNSRYTASVHQHHLSPLASTSAQATHDIQPFTASYIRGESRWVENRVNDGNGRRDRDERTHAPMCLLHIQWQDICL